MREYKGEFTIKGVVFVKDVTKEEAESILAYSHLVNYNYDNKVIAEINLVKVELEC